MGTDGLRIAYLSGSPRIATGGDASVTGPRAHVLGTIDALRSCGHEVETFVVGDAMSPRVSGRGSERLVSGGAGRQLAVDAARLALRQSGRRRAVRALSGPFDLVYERFALFQELGRPFQRRGAAWVLETNALMSEEARHERNALALRRTARRLELSAYGRADLVVAVSETLRQVLVAQASVPADKVVVVPNGVDVRRFSPTGRGAGAVAAGGDVVVGFVGFVIERQGVDELVHAVHALRKRSLPVRAVVVGDGPDRRRLERLTERLGLGTAVRFTGQVRWDQVPACIDGFSVGYSGQRGVAGMPMYHSPLKLYEYLAMGRPVVASDHADAREALVGHSAGWTFPAGDVDALVAQLQRVVELPPAVLTAYGERGRRHVEERHSWVARVRDLERELRLRRLVAGSS